MKRIVMLVVAGLVLVPVVARTQQTATSFQLPLANYPENDNCLAWGGTNPAFQQCGKAGKHTADDACVAAGTNVLAAANGRVKYAQAHGTCPNWAWLVVVEHTLPGGAKVCSIYGHCEPIAGISDGTNVVKGQHIAEVKHVSCWSDHIHFGIYDGAYGATEGTYATWINGYMPDNTTCEDYPTAWPGNYVDPVDFIADHQGDTYIADYLGQRESVTPWMAPNTSRTEWVDYQNDGTATWTSSVELRSLTGALPCLLTNGCAYDPADWITQQRITVANQGSVGPGSTARFQFQVKASSTTGSCVQWVAPWVPGGTCMDGWGGVNFTIRTDATQPTPFTATVTPSSNTTNSFSFSWTASSDDHSGLAGYYWRVNGNSETFTASTSVPAGSWATQSGTNTLYVRAVDNVGNSYAAPPVDFTLNGGPCPGRQIPNDCVPPTQCYPAASANLQTLPNLTVEQWAVVGSPMQDKLEAGQTYSLNFEYRASTSQDLQLGFGSFSLNTKTVIVGDATLAPAVEDWKAFWSAPFTVTAEQIRDFPNLRLLAKAAGTEIRNVRILKTGS